MSQDSGAPHSCPNGVWQEEAEMCLKGLEIPRVFLLRGPDPGQMGSFVNDCFFCGLYFTSLLLILEQDSDPSDPKSQHLIPQHPLPPGNLALPSLFLDPSRSREDPRLSK